EAFAQASRGQQPLPPRSALRSYPLRNARIHGHSCGPAGRRSSSSSCAPKGWGKIDHEKSETKGRRGLCFGGAMTACFPDNAKAFIASATSLLRPQETKDALVGIVGLQLSELVPFHLPVPLVPGRWLAAKIAS